MAVIDCTPIVTYLTLIFLTKIKFMNSTGKILVGIAAGAAVGALLGVLFAPDKGSETRRKIKERGKKISDDLQEKFAKGKEKFNDMKEDIRETMRDTKEKFS